MPGPQIRGASLNATGMVLTVTYSEPVVGWRGHFIIDPVSYPKGGLSLTKLSHNGEQLQFTLNHPITDPNALLSYKPFPGGGIQSVDGVPVGIYENYPVSYIPIP